MFSNRSIRLTSLRMVLLACLILDLSISPMHTVKIEQLIVPEVVQLANSTSAVLDCQYSGVSNQVTVQWLYNGSEVPVYQWSPRTEPKVSGVLEGRLDLTYKASPIVTEERRALHIVSLDPQLSGQYTCRVLDQLAEARQTKNMLVFSPEKDFLLEFRRQNEQVEVKCTARGLYPQPELVLEHGGLMIQKQQQRVWRNEGVFFDVEGTAELPTPGSDSNKAEQITCRLQLPQAGYSAIKKELLHFGPDCLSSSISSQITFSIMMLIFGITKTITE